MTNLKSTKRALFTSVIALVLCFVMLLGSTFAWFTDSAASTGNKIVTGDLDVELYQWVKNPETGVVESKNISDSHDPVFTGDILWEPGKTEVVYLSIKNAGDLALKYQVALDVTSTTRFSLTDVMQYSITPDALYGSVNAWDSTRALSVIPASNTTANDVAMQPGDEHFFALSVHMLETAGNDYMKQSITFDIRVLAGQLVSEFDSFGNTYDELAGYPGTGYAGPITGNQTAAEITIVDDQGYNVGSVVIPKAATPDDTTPLNVKVIKGNYDTNNITVTDPNTGNDIIKYDVKVEGLKENNDVPVKVQLKIPTGLNPATVALYHYDNEIDCDYNPNTGYVSFETATFSPFTVFFDADSEYVAPAIPQNKPVPTATVTYLGVNAGEDTINWGNYGQWSPTEGLDAELEASFKFVCPTNLDPEVRAAFEYWYCDFYVSLDRDLGANQIFLGGNYGDFGWVGFHNGDLTLAAGTEIGLLSSVTTNPWTYADVENFVGEFICGVGDVDDALDGATFTVKLRLTNPEDSSNFYDVNIVTYTFGGDYSIK